jgi:type IV secretion system protein VirD4
MSIDELSVMDGGKCILQVRGVRPFLSEKFDIMKHKNYRYLSDANPKNAFNIERFVSTKLKVKPDEEYEFYDCTLPDYEMPEEAFDDFGGFDPDDLEPI